MATSPESGDQGEASAHRLSPTATSPVQVTSGEAGYQGGNVADPVWQSWRDELAKVGGPSPLLHFVDSPRTRIELSTTHPGGLPPFISGKTTLLSSLIRDELALRTAKNAAGAITDKGIELRSVRGIEGVHLAIGLAQWRAGDTEFTAPVLLRPLAIRRYGRDFELKLKGQPYFNPQLARALKQQFGITIDPEQFVELAVQNGVFKPQPVIDQLRGLTSHLPWFAVHPRLVVSSFADVAGDMLRDARMLEHPVLDAVAGNPAAKRALQQSQKVASIIPQDERPPATDNLLLDADAEQEQVIANIAAGNSLVVKTLPGTGGTQTIVNAIGALAAQHKRVLVVSARRSSLDSIHQRLLSAGLGGIAVGPRTLRRDLIQSIGRNEKAARPSVSEIDDALLRLRKVLLDYRGALSRRDESFGVSALQALEELARLSQLRTPPSTAARLDRRSVTALAHSRPEATRMLIESARLGEFRYGPGDSPWYGAQFDSTADAEIAHELAKRLHLRDLPRLLDRAQDVIGQTRMRPFESVAELGIYLRLLQDVRETLDKFQPAVFDRSIQDLIVATSPRREAAEMSSTNRRRLKKLAREYLRPGAHVTDLNAALRRVQQQRTLWQRYAVAGTIPEVPVGVADVQVAYQQVTDQLSRLDEPLGRRGTNLQLASLPLAELASMMSGLAEDSEVLANLQERTTLLATLRDWGLDPLLTDLSRRHVPAELVAGELDLAWWRSALEIMLTDERALLGGNTSVLDRLEADFKLVDEAHAASSAELLAWKLSETWKIGLVDWPQERDALRALLRTEAATTPQELQKAAPHLSRVLAPAWLASPYEVHRIGTETTFDAVFLVDAGATTLAENVGAIRRAKQVVAFGDPVTQTPTPFGLRVDETPEFGSTASRTDVEALHAQSALARLGELLNTVTLTRSYRAGGEDLAELVNRRFYGGRIDSLPWAGSFLGHDSLRFHYIASGHGMPENDSGAVESVDAEVAKVVELVLEHAVIRPRESLMVITASPRHAVRVQQAVLTAFAKRTDLSDFILGDRPEPFAVVTLEQSVAQSRDRVIFSIGYGRTPHGRLLSNFGALAEPGGERLLAVGMTRARRSMDIVSCFRPGDIDESRMRYGMVALAQVLQEAEDRVQPSDRDDYSEPMLVDLAARLERRGLRVNIGHKGKLALVAAHGTRAVVVETDRDVSTQSLRVSLRLRPELLRRLGWHYLRVHNFELFADPEAVAARVAGLIGATAGEEQTPAPAAGEAPAAPAAPAAAAAPASGETQPVEPLPHD
ncbi:DEAD/DEAH box helicase [Rathayibacter sp. AY1F9]|uniref:DEAD/DEAH box helicase n=1 Tax=Rathayibacter sp. AY1F9 TaxID=2080563 RepID=UPI0035BEA0C3